MNEKTLVFDNGGAMDGNLVAALMNGNNRNNGYGNGYGWEWMWMILLWALWGGNGWGGFGGRGNGLSNLPAELNGDAGRQLLMNAIQGNGTAINQLASSLNCSVQQIQTALCNIQAQSGLSAQQIINAVQSGNAQVLSQMASCCCDVRTAIERQGYESQLATLNQTNTLTSNANTQFNALGSKIDAQTQVINDRFCALEMREMQNKLDAERAKSAALAGQQVNHDPDRPCKRSDCLCPSKNGQGDPFLFMWQRQRGIARPNGSALQRDRLRVHVFRQGPRPH